MLILGGGCFGADIGYVNIVGTGRGLWDRGYGFYILGGVVPCGEFGQTLGMLIWGGLGQIWGIIILWGWGSFGTDIVDVNIVGVGGLG